MIAFDKGSTHIAGSSVSKVFTKSKHTLRNMAGRLALAHIELKELVLVGTNHFLRNHGLVLPNAKVIIHL